MFEVMKSFIWGNNSEVSNRVSQQIDAFSAIVLRNRSSKKDALVKLEAKEENFEDYFSTKATLVGLKPLDTNHESIYNTLPPTKEVMQKYYKERRNTRRSLKFGYASPKCSIRVDTKHNVHLEIASSKSQTKQISFDIRHISGYGSHYDYLDVFSIIVVDEIFDYIPTCLVFKFQCLKDRHKMAESFIETLNWISTDLNGVFSWDSSSDLIADLENDNYY